MKINLGYITGAAVAAHYFGYLSRGWVSNILILHGSLMIIIVAFSLFMLIAFKNSEQSTKDKLSGSFYKTYSKLKKMGWLKKSVLYVYNLFLIYIGYYFGSYILMGGCIIYLLMFTYARYRLIVYYDSL